ncbi:MAG: hypothetical protein PHP01_02015 [Phycisphaerae bacterium]|nr:hypothetical protein [Phycisphaerae bacterium]
MFKKICLSALLLASVFLAHGYSQEAEKIIFSGIPVLKISEGGVSRVVEDVKEDKALEFKCTITKIGDKYFWTSRDNVELIRIQSRAYLTFVATSGAGYVRIILPEMKDAAALIDETEKRYDYVEHMLIGLKSVTYYGKSR